MEQKVELYSGSPDHLLWLIQDDQKKGWFVHTITPLHDPTNYNTDVTVLIIYRKGNFIKN